MLMPNFCTGRALLSRGAAARPRFSRLFAPSDEGGALVEFAVVLPMMMVLITGMFSFGLVLNNYMVLTTSVGAGSRALALSRGQTTPALAASDPCAYAVQVAESSGPFLNPKGMSFNIAWTTTDSTGKSTTTNYTSNTCTAMSLNQGDNVQISGSYSTNLLLFGWKPGALKMTATTSELVE